MIVHQEWGEVGRRHMQLPCCTSKSGGGGPGSRTWHFWHFLPPENSNSWTFVWKWFSFSGDGEPILCCVQKHSPIHSTSCYCAFYRWPLLIIHSFLNFEGPLSDRYGRIPALLFSLGMNCLCYTGDRKSHNRQVNIKEKFTAWPKASYFLHVVCWYPPGCRF